MTRLSYLALSCRYGNVIEIFGYKRAGGRVISKNRCVKRYVIKFIYNIARPSESGQAVILFIRPPRRTSLTESLWQGARRIGIAIRVTLRKLQPRLLAPIRGSRLGGGTAAALECAIAGTSPLATAAAAAWRSERACASSTCAAAAPRESGAGAADADEEWGNRSSAWSN